MFGRQYGHPWNLSKFLYATSYSYCTGTGTYLLTCQPPWPPGDPRATIRNFKLLVTSRKQVGDDLLRFQFCAPIFCCDLSIRRRVDAKRAPPAEIEDGHRSIETACGWSGCLQSWHFCSEVGWARKHRLLVPTNLT